MFVDTSVWSLAFRRSNPAEVSEVRVLVRAIADRRDVVSTGLVLQELLQGFTGPKDRNLLLDRFSAVPLLAPTRQDHIAAAELRNRCRRSGVQVGTIDALLAQLCVAHDLSMLSTDADFRHMARHCDLKVWKPD